MLTILSTINENIQKRTKIQTIINNVIKNKNNIILPNVDSKDSLSWVNIG